MIHLEAKFFSNSEFMKQVHASEIQWWDKHKIDDPILKGRHGKEEWGDGSLKSPKTSKAKSIRS